MTTNGQHAAAALLTPPPGGNTAPVSDAVAAALAKAKSTTTLSAVTDDPHQIDSDLRRKARAIASDMLVFKQLIEKAKTHRVHEALGFKSWPAYVADVIGTQMGQLPIDDRRQIVALLSREGMSNRAIAQAVGVSHPTVIRDKAASEADQEVVHDVPPEPPPRTPGEPPEESYRGVPQEGDETVGWWDDGTAFILGKDILEKVTGRDGKTYPAHKEPKPKPSNPFVNRYYRHLSALQDDALKLEILCKHDDFAAHLDELCGHHREGVLWAHEIITRVLDQMQTDQQNLF
jgi:hypothetical protein